MCYEIVITSNKISMSTIEKSMEKLIKTAYCRFTGPGIEGTVQNGICSFYFKRDVGGMDLYYFKHFGAPYDLEISEAWIGTDLKFEPIYIDELSNELESIHRTLNAFQSELSEQFLTMKNQNKTLELKFLEGVLDRVVNALDTLAKNLNWIRGLSIGVNEPVPMLK